MKKKLSLTTIIIPLATLFAFAQPSTPLTLRQLTDSALAHSNAMSGARHDMEAARQQRKETFTKFFPTVSATALTFNANRAMAKMDVDPASMIPASLSSTLSLLLPAEALTALASPVSISMMKNGTIAGITAMQPLFAGGQIVNANRLARVGEEAARLQLDMKENEVERQVATYFWQLLTLQEKRRTVEAVDTLLADIHKDVEVAVRAGVALGNDLLQVQLRRNDLESQRLKLDNGIAIVTLLLQQYCGLSAPPSPIAESEGDLSAETPAIGNHLLPLLPEYRLLEQQVEASRLQKKLAVGQQLPTLALGAGYNYHNLLDNDRTFAMLFATISVPISGWWGGSHAIRRRSIELQKAEESLHDNAQLLTIGMQKAANDVGEARQQLRLAHQAIDQAEENLRICRNRYHAGTATMSTLLEAQLLCQQANDRLADATADLHLRLIDLRQATGQ